MKTSKTWSRDDDSGFLCQREIPESQEICLGEFKENLENIKEKY